MSRDDGFGSNGEWIDVAEIAPIMVVQTGELSAEVVQPLALSFEGDSAVYASVEKGFFSTIHGDMILVPHVRILVAAPCGHHRHGSMPIDVCLN